MNNSSLLFIFQLIPFLTFSQNFAFIKEEKLLASIPEYNIVNKSLDSLKVVLKQESKAIQVENQNRILKLFEAHHIYEEPLLENLYLQLKKVDTKAYQKLLNEQEQLIQTIKAKELVFHQAYKNKMMPIIERTNLIVQEYCKSKGISALYKLDQIESNMAYLDTKLDITEELIKYIYEVK